MKDNKKNKIILIVTGIIIIVSLCIGFTKKEFENDTFYTIKVGETIVKNGIDMIDHFSWHKLSYCYPHWLYDVMIYKIYDIFGFVGIYISTMILYIILGLLVFFINIKRTKSTFISLVMTIITTIVCGVYATARAQLVSYIIFVLELYFIERLLSSSKKRYMIVLILLSTLLANVHAAVWPFFFILFMPYILENVVSIIKSKVSKNKQSKIFKDTIIIKKDEGFKLLLITMIICIFTGLLTPIKDIPYTYAIRIMLGNTQEYINEHKALALINNPFALCYIVLFFLSVSLTKVKIKLSDFVMICGLILMSLMSIRHVSFLLTLGMIELTKIITDILSLKNKEVFDLELPWIGSLVIMVVVIICSKFIYDNTSNKDYIDKNKYPTYALKYLQENYNMKEVKLYNDYDFGSYLLFKNVKVYIDSRSDLYTKQFNNKYDIFDECMTISDNYGRVFNKYKITHVLTYSSTELSKILTVSDNFKEVYYDGAFKIFEVNSNYKDKNN